MKVKELHASFIYNAEEFKKLGGYESFFLDFSPGYMDNSYIGMKLGAAGFVNIYDTYIEFTHLAAPSEDRELSNIDLSRKINEVLLKINPGCKDLAEYEGRETDLIIPELDGEPMPDVQDSYTPPVETIGGKEE